MAATSGMAVERIILVGPKTIGAGWKDNIVLEPRHFLNARPGYNIGLRIVCRSTRATSNGRNTM